jgi:hypothetical protein
MGLLQVLGCKGFYIMELGFMDIVEVEGKK